MIINTVSDVSSPHQPAIVWQVMPPPGLAMAKAPACVDGWTRWRIPGTHWWQEPAGEKNDESINRKIMNAGFKK